MSNYYVSFEIAGATAMFTRPDSGSTPISYPVPTEGAVKGMFESVARMRGVYIQPTHVKICQPIQYERYTTNYGGPLRKDNQISGNNNLQIIATVLTDVCYQIFGVIRYVESSSNEINWAHALQDRFERRLRHGKLYHTPCLGWKEFTPSYFGPTRPETKTEDSINIVIPSLLRSVFDRPVGGRWGPTFVTNAQITGGVLYYQPMGVRHAE